MISFNIRNILQIIEDRKKRVILYISYPTQILCRNAQIERISPHDIHTIVKEEESISTSEYESEEEITQKKKA